MAMIESTAACVNGFGEFAASEEIKCAREERD